MIFKRIKELEAKVDAIAKDQGITFEEQPKFKIVKGKGEMGFTVKK